jgi:serine phosphatase RsbU (regulator of sigma subunit)
VDRVLEDVSRLLEDESFVLEPGDVVLLYADGITELRLQGQLLGDRRAGTALQLTAREGYGPSAIIRNLIESVADLTANDDVTLLALRYSPDAPSCPPCALRPPYRNLRPGT